MNVSKIVDMLKDDPAILQKPDVASFITKMNLKNIDRIVQQPVVVQQAVTIQVSIAQMNGGACTLKDVQAAVAQVQAKPLFDDVELRMAAVRAAIADGSATTSAQIKAIFATDPTP